MTDSWEVVARAAELAPRGGAAPSRPWSGDRAPRRGSRARVRIVTADGQIFGWIAGACAEPTVIREAQRAIVDGEPRLLLLGDPEQFGHVPDGMAVIPLTCQSDGALEVYIEPVVSTPHLVVVGRSPMSHTLRDLAQVLGWRAELADGAEFSATEVDARSVVVVATQGHGDEEAVEHAVKGSPAYVGLVASRSGVRRCSRSSPTGECRSTSSIGCGCRSASTWATRRTARSRCRFSPSWSSCGQQGRLASDHVERPPRSLPEAAIDPVCGMTVTISPSALALDMTASPTTSAREGCRTSFAKEARC